MVWGRWRGAAPASARCQWQAATVLVAIITGTVRWQYQRASTRNGRVRLGVTNAPGPGHAPRCAASRAAACGVHLPCHDGRRSRTASAALMGTRHPVWAHGIQFIVACTLSRTHSRYQRTSSPGGRLGVKLDTVTHIPGGGVCSTADWEPRSQSESLQTSTSGR